MGATPVNPLQSYCDRFQRLHVDQHQGRPRPHKAVMLLSVISLVENGKLIENRIPYDSELLGLFRRFFDVVRGLTDQCSPYNPFYYMMSERFWHLHPIPGSGLTPDALPAPRSSRQLNSTVAYASLDEELFDLIAQPVGREALRTALIDRYFSAQREALLALFREERDVFRVCEDWAGKEYKIGRGEAEGTPEEVRSEAFRRTVKQAYDYRCAACGIRFLFENITIIDAAHLVPFEETADNSPQNGIALCKNHHWLMDRRLLAPGPARGNQYDDLRWHVLDDLDERIEGQREVLRLKDQSVILPADKRLRPKRESIDRRMEMLGEAS